MSTAASPARGSHGLDGFSVGASLLAKNVNDYAGIRNERSGCGFFASKLAPTQFDRCRAMTDAFKCGLACDGINRVWLMYRGVCIAGKPAPTLTAFGMPGTDQSVALTLTGAYVEKFEGSSVPLQSLLIA